MAPEEICRSLGEERYLEMFSCLNAKQIKEILGLANIPATRPAGTVSIKKRNEEWARRLWRAMPTGRPDIGTLLLYQWLSQKRTAMMGAFLDALGVAHQNGLTQEEFFPGLPDERVREAAQQLLDNPAFDRREVAAYLLFLELQSKTEKLAPLQLEEVLAAPAA